MLAPMTLHPEDAEVHDLPLGKEHRIGVTDFTGFYQSGFGGKLTTEFLEVAGIALDIDILQPFALSILFYQESAFHVLLGPVLCPPFSEVQ